MPSIWRWARRLALGLLASGLLAGLAGACYQFAATRSLEREHPPPGRLIDVGGHRLHLHSQGTGKPTVVIDAGLSGASYDWETVASIISTFTTVCTYDRAGYGWSDPGPRPRTSQRAVAELHTLLRAAKLEPPFILVGHSWGALNARLFASQHPEEVAGLVLVDALNTDLLPANSTFSQVPAVFKLLNATAWCGTTWLAVPAYVNEPSNDSKRLRWRRAMLSRSKSVHAIYDELAGEANWREVRSALRHLGSTPVVVISRRIVENNSTNSAELSDQDWLRGQRALPKISSNSTFVMAQTDIHDIQFHEPDLIVNQVRRIVESAQALRFGQP